MNRLITRAARPLLLIASVAIALVAAELIVRLAVPLRLVGPSVTEYDSIYGFRNRRGFSGSQTTPEFTWTVSFNSLGQRGPEPEPDARSILFLGDSFTVGLGVNDGEEFVGIVRERLGGSGVNVLNAGLGNTGQGRWLKYLERDAAAFHPCLVVFQIFRNDFWDNVREGLFQIDSAGVLVEQPLRTASRGRQAQALLQRMPWLTHSHLYGLTRQAYHSLWTRRAPARQPTGAELAAIREREDGLTYRLLEEATAIINRQGWPAIALVAALPPNRLERVTELLEERGVQVASMAGSEERPEWYYEIDGHWNKHGHAQAAEEILRMINLRTDLACDP